MPDEKDQQRTQLNEFRRLVANVVTELRSQEIRDTYAAITLNEVIDQQLLYLTGTGKKLGRKQKLTKARDEFLAVLDAIKAVPPSTFKFPDEDEDVNTPPEAEEGA